MPSHTEIFDRIYSGFLGKAIGVRLGAPVEPTIWSYERIRDTYGDFVWGEDSKSIFWVARDENVRPVAVFCRRLESHESCCCGCSPSGCA